MANAAALGKMIQRLRKARGLTQADAAARIGIGRSTLAGIEAGLAMPGRETQEAIADLFKVPLDHLRRASEPGGPSRGQIIDDPDELALVAFWRGLSDEQRTLVLRMLTVPPRAQRPSKKSG